MYDATIMHEILACMKRQSKIAGIKLKKPLPKICAFRFVVFKSCLQLEIK